ncbi:MAG: hypothetical protein AAGH79_05480, partial [Bacteroidota bacterium]
MIAYNLEQALPQATTVQELHLVGRGLRTLAPEIVQCKNLRKMVLRRNQLTTLPTWLAELPSLEEIDISDNPFVHWPDHVGPQLLVLNAENTALRLSTDTLRAFPNLRMLNCAGCTLEGEAATLYLPPHLEQLIFRKLAAKKLPQGLLHLSRLKILDASQNQLTQWPRDLPIRLESLNLSYNRIRS